MEHNFCLGKPSRLKGFQEGFFFHEENRHVSCKTYFQKNLRGMEWDKFDRKLWRGLGYTEDFL